MDCTEARALLLDRRRGLLTGEPLARVESHLAECEECRREDAADAELSLILEARLPKRQAPLALRRSIEERFVARAPQPRGARSLGVRAAIAGGVLAVAAAVALFVWRPWQPDPMVTEAVNDHLRVLYSSHPLEVESGGVHQVKPWFEGRVDFAPVVAFGGDDDFPLQGGSIAWFIDRKAATYIYKRRLHLITLFVYRAERLPWAASPAGAVTLGRVHATEQTVRGFHVLLWRDGDLGYALVSDVDPHDLETLVARLAGGNPP